MVDGGGPAGSGTGIRLESVELRRVRLPLATPFRTAAGTTTARDVLLVRVLAAGAEGWGECVAPLEPVYTEEYVDGAHDVLRRHLLPRLLAHGRVSADAVAPALAAVKGHRMAKAALESAVLDAELRTVGRSLAAHLGGVRDTVECGAVVGIVEPVAALVEAVERCLADGYRRVKLKIQPGWDVEPVAAVREHVGDGACLGVDANGAYRPADTGHLARLDRFGLALIEQPFPADHLLAHAELARRIRTPVCLDESVTSVATATDAMALGAAGVINVKPGRVGGLLEARRVHDACAARHVPVLCGGMLETGIGRSAALALATLANFSLPADLSASERYYRTDLTLPFVANGGTLVVPDAPGTGVTVLSDVLDEVTESVEVVQGGR